MLRNPVYAGLVGWERRASKGNPIHNVNPRYLQAEGAHERIIERQTWEMVQKLIDRKRQLPGRMATGSYPLTGVSWCGLCGDRMHGFESKAGKHRPRDQRYYCCARRRSKGGCTLPFQPADQLEADLLRRLEAMDDPDRLAEAYHRMQDSEEANAAQAEADRLRADVQAVERKIARWEKAYEDGMPAESIRKRLDPLLLQRRAMQERLAALKPRVAEAVSFVDLARSIGDLVEDWTHLESQERKTLVHAIVERVTIGPDGITDLRHRF